MNISSKDLKKLEALKNKKVMQIVEHYANLCQPEKVRVFTGTKEDEEAIRELSLQNGEEKKLKMNGHTVHFDNYKDQARDVKNTRILLPKGKKLSKFIETIDKDEGLADVFSLMKGIMKGKDMLVCFYSLGPSNSMFSIPALQLTDSAYVAHSENILYRNGYKDFLNLKGSPDFFHFVHSAGELDENNTSKNIDKRRVYIDLEEERVLTINNQYAGNSIGLKKLALRLAISKAAREDWLCEHMFITGVKPKGKRRTTYFTGAFPSMCGKTSTAMIPGQTIIGDDIAYLKKDKHGYCVAANVEQGIFGIIQDINPIDDPVIYHALTTPRELIFSNVLIADGKPYWLGMGCEIADKGINHSGEWFKGKKDSDGKEITPSHKNARFTLRIRELDNADPKVDDPSGVRIDGIIYGGRDSDTTVPVFQSLDWKHGVFVGSAVESETTAASLRSEGELIHNPMANIEFLTIPLGKYIEIHLKFGESLKKTPLIFHTNYFLKKDGQFVNKKTDKKAWIIWMEGRVHNEYDAIKSPIGYLPKYEDLENLFMHVLNRKYSLEEYNYQFAIRVQKLLDKLKRIEAIYKSEQDVPEEFHKQIEQQRDRLLKAREKAGKDVITPDEL